MLIQSVLVVLSFFFVGLFPSASFAANFSAEIVDVDGKAYITPKAGSVPVSNNKPHSKSLPVASKKSGDIDHLYEAGELVNEDGKITVTPGKAVPATKGQQLFPGDVIETREAAEVELLFADGNITRVGEKTKLTIGELFVEKGGARRAVMDLVVGRIKNSVLKLANKQSKFEVHTKTAVAGVTGTPHWIVSVDSDFEPKVEVNLLSDTDGKEATQGVSVRSLGKSGKSVVLKPGSGTEVDYGNPPDAPKGISKETIEVLRKLLPIKTSMSTQRDTRRRFDDIWGATVAKREEPREPVAAPEQPVEEAPNEKAEFGKQDYNTVQFDSKPEGAEVYVDGKFLGNTPLSIPVQDGPHNVKMSIEGYADWSKMVKTSSGFRVQGILEKRK